MELAYEKSGNGFLVSLRYQRQKVSSTPVSPEGINEGISLLLEHIRNALYDDKGFGSGNRKGKPLTSALKVAEGRFLQNFPVGSRFNRRYPDVFGQWMAQKYFVELEAIYPLQETRKNSVSSLSMKL